MAWQHTHRVPYDRRHGAATSNGHDVTLKSLPKYLKKFKSPITLVKNSWDSFTFPASLYTHKATLTLHIPTGSLIHTGAVGTRPVHGDGFVGN